MTVTPQVCFLKTFTAPASLKEICFNAAHEGLRKAVERCFGVLQVS